MLIQCTHMTAVSLQKRTGAQLDAYQSIIDQSDVVLAVYDPASAREDDVDQAMSYARDKRRLVIAIHPDTLAVQVSEVRSD